MHFLGGSLEKKNNKLYETASSHKYTKNNKSILMDIYAYLQEEVGHFKKIFEM